MMHSLMNIQISIFNEDITSRLMNSSILGEYMSVKEVIESIV